jgi:Uma2 family endonuclease
METEATKKLFTVDDYHRMGDIGIIHPEERVELIDGEIIQMSPRGYRHTMCVERANELFVRGLGDRAVVGPGSPVRLSNWTEPEPDVVIFKSRAWYQKRNRGLEDVLLILEISASSLRFDQNIKLPRYAAVGIPEVWIADLQNNILHVHREPGGQAYKTELTLRPGDSVSPLGFPDVSLKVDELLSTDCNIE